MIPRTLPLGTLALLIGACALLSGCKEDPLKDWSNTKLQSKASVCAKTKQHNPRSGLICSQVEESCAFRKLNCR